MIGGITLGDLQKVLTVEQIQKVIEEHLSDLAEGVNARVDHWSDNCPNDPGNDGECRMLHRTPFTADLETLAEEISVAIIEELVQEADRG